MEARRAGDGSKFQALQRGWYLGDEESRQELLAQMKGKRGAEHFGENASVRTYTLNIYVV